MFHLYVRVSTKKQAAIGTSIDMQYTALRKFAVERGESFEVYIDNGVSGVIPLDGRPFGKGLLNDVQSGDTVVVSTLDRLFRDPIDGLLVAQELHDANVKIHTLDNGLLRLDDAMSRYQFTNALALARYEHDKAKERTANTKRHQRNANAFLGGYVPFGKRVIHTSSGALLVDNEDEQRIIKFICNKADQGASSKEIESLVLTEFGESISSRTVLRIIKRSKMKND